MLNVGTKKRLKKRRANPSGFRYSATNIVIQLCYKLLSISVYKSRDLEELGATSS